MSELAMDTIEVLTFDPPASRGKLKGLAFSLWNTNEKACGITFSPDITEKYAVKEGEDPWRINIAVNKISNEVYIIFDKRGELSLGIAGKLPRRNFVIHKRRDVVNKLSQILKVDFSNPATKQHMIFGLKHMPNDKIEAYQITGRLDV